VIRSILNFLMRLSQRSMDHDVRGRAATLAFYGLLALFPGLLGLLGLLSFLDLTSELRVVQAVIDRSLPADAAALIQREIARLMGLDRARPLTLSLVFTIYYAGRAVGIGLRGVHVAWEIKTRRRWLWVRVMGGALAGVGLVGVVLALSLPRLAVAGVEWFEGLMHYDFEAPQVVLKLQFPLMVLIYQQAVNVLYRSGQRLKVGWGWWSWGSLLACGAWLGLSQLFGLYLSTFSDLGLTYGSLGAVVGLLIYLHMLGWGLFMGAELDAMLYAEKRRAESKPGDSFRKWWRRKRKRAEESEIDPVLSPTYLEE